MKTYYCFDPIMLDIRVLGSFDSLEAARAATYDGQSVLEREDLENLRENLTDLLS